MGWSVLWLGQSEQEVPSGQVSAESKQTDRGGPASAYGAEFRVLAELAEGA